MWTLLLTLATAPQVVPSAPALMLQAGQAVRIAVPFVPQRPAEGTAWGRVVEPNGRAGELLPYVRVLPASDGLEARYTLTAAPQPTRGLISAKLELFDAKGPLGSLAVEHRLAVGPTKATLDEIKSVADEYRSATEKAVRLRAKLGSLGSQPLTRPQVTLPKGQETAFLELLEALDDARAPRRTLLAAAAHPASEIEVAATTALLGPSAERFDTRIFDAMTIGAALEAARQALDGLQVDRAEAIAHSLLQAGRLNANELAQVLLLRGLLAKGRGDTLAARFWAQSACIDPTLPLDLRRPFWSHLLEVARRSRPCSQPLTVRAVKARQIRNNGQWLQVDAEFGPDPGGLVSMAEVQLWGFGGAMYGSERISAPKEGRVQVHFVDDNQLQNSTGHILITVLLRHESGVTVASLGEPDARSVPVEPPSAGIVDVPWWIWALAGGVLVVGAATTLALTRDGDIQRGLGPTEIRF